MTTSLEDNAEDILSKAMRGQSISATDLAASLATAESAILDALRNPSAAASATPDLLRKISEALGLSAPRLLAIAKDTYLPAPVTNPHGLFSIESSYGSMLVNCFLVASGKDAALFDTGTNPEIIFSLLAKHSLTLRHVFLTHTHADHVCELTAIASQTRASVWTPKKEPIFGASPLSHNQTFALDSLHIIPRNTPGHSPGGTTYEITGLTSPVAVVGDALFAGSVGGIKANYAASLNAIRSEILSLPDSTILCPGHGPSTTVADQKQNNPFFP